MAARRLWQQYFIVFGVVLATTLTLFKLKPYMGDAKVSLLYLLIVLVCAAIAHPSVTLFCGLFSFLCYDFFLVPPLFDFRFATPQQILDPLAFLIVAVVTGALAERSRQQADEKLAYQKADQLRATLLNLISHNLWTPLATIKTALTTLLTLDELQPESRDLLIYADQECDHLNRLVANVLQLSRVEAKAVQIKKQWDALDELIQTVLQRWPQELAEGQLSANLANMPPLLFDFDLIEAVLINLVENALRHGQPPVLITFKQDPTEVWVTIEDHGPGIPPADRGRLFQGHAKARGIGLGLAVAKGLIEAHGGRIWAEFAPGLTRFTFTLPFTPDTQLEA